MCKAYYEWLPFFYGEIYHEMSIVVVLMSLVAIMKDQVSTLDACLANSNCFLKYKKDCSIRVVDLALCTITLVEKYFQMLQYPGFWDNNLSC